MTTMILRKLDKLTVISALGLSLAALGSHAAIVDINFEGEGYEDGEPLPAPWSVSGGGGALVEAGMGYAGGQGLVSSNTSMEFLLPDPLTSDMGAVNVSVYIKPPTSSDFFSQAGGMQLALPGVAQYSATFARDNANQQVYAPEGQFSGGTNIGSWAANTWYELEFSIHPDWANITVTVSEVDGLGSFSDTFSWGGQNITEIILFGSNDTAGNPTVYDNFTVIPEPSVYAFIAGLVGLGCILLRRRHARVARG